MSEIRNGLSPEVPSSKNRRLIVTGSVAPIVSAALTVPGVARSQAAPTEITIYHYQVDRRAEAFKSIVRRFETANPDVKVNEVFKTDATITAELQAAMAARRPVDLATVIGIRSHYFRMRTGAVAFDEQPDKARWLDGYLPNFLDVGRHAGKIYAVPYAFGTPLLYFNRDLARAAGLNPDQPPKTWPETIEWARRIQAHSNVPGIAQIHGSNKVYGTMLMARNAGGRYIAESGDRVVLDSAEGIAAMQLWQDLAVKHKVMPIANDAQWSAAFQGGRLAMYITSSAALRQTIDSTKGRFELGVAQYPLFEGRSQRQVPNSGATFMLYSPPGPRRDATLRFMAFMSELKVANEWARESGYMPLKRDALSDPAMRAYVDDVPQVRPVIAQMAETVATEQWTHANALQAESVISSMIDDLWAGRKPAAELVPDAVRRANAALSRPG